MEVLGKNVANGMAIWLSGLQLIDFHDKAMKEFDEGDFQSLDLLHHLTAGVKSFATEMCYVGLDEMR